MKPSFESYLEAIGRQFAKPLWVSSVSASVVSISAVGLLGLSGWFLTATAIAGAGGPIIVQSLNYIWPSALIRLLAILRTVFRYIERLMGHEAGLKALATIRPDLFHHISDIAPYRALSLSTGDTSSRLIQDLGSLETEIVTRSAIPYAVSGISIALLMNFCLGIQAALVCFCGFLVQYALSKKFATFINQSNERHDNGDELAETANLKACIYELMPVLPDIKAYEFGDNYLLKAEKIENKIIFRKQNRQNADNLLAVLSTNILMITLIIVYFINNTQSTSLLAMGLLSIIAGFESANGSLQRLIMNPLFRAAKSRISEIYTLPTFEANTAKTSSVIKLIYRSQNIVFDKFTRLKICGPSGCGKTRLINSLVGFISPDYDRGFSTGSVFSTEDFSLCAQDAQIISATIKDNLTMAFDHIAMPNTPKYKAQAEDIIRAVEDAGLAEKVKSLPKGLDTWIGDGGISLSGGERKRLALARAYLRSAPVIILDEPTEGLDGKMEAFIISRLKARLKETRQALIFTSHRPALANLATHSLIV